MIFESLTLENFRAYAGEQTIEFGAPSATQPVTLIGGLNGAGKTSFLEALLHVLYGPHAASLVGRKGAYDAFLLESINRGAGPEQGAAVELAMKVHRGGSEQSLRVRRSWNVQSGRIRERLDVYLDGSYDESLSETWPEVVEGLIPRGVARLFFFDGEQVEALADFDRAGETIRNAIGSLLGLGLVGQLQTDLAALVRRNAKESAPPVEQLMLDEVEQEVVDARQRLETKRAELASSRNHFDLARNRLADAEERYRLNGGELYAGRARLEEEKHEAERSVADALAALRHLAAEATPLLLLQREIDALADEARKERERSVESSALSILEPRDASLLAWLRDSGIDAPVAERVGDYLHQDRAARLQRLDSPEAPLVDQAGARVESLAHSELDILRGELIAKLDELEQARERLERTDRKAAQVPSVESVASLDDELRREQQLVAHAQQETTDVEDSVGMHERELERRLATRDKVFQKLARSQISDDERQRVTEFAGRAQQTVAELERRAVARHLARIEGFALEATQQLLRKETLIERLAIDLPSYALRLYGPHDAPVSAAQLSAGERQLVALSLLWALARAAGRPLPVVIDTPLGRLDATHRQHIVDRYLPHASHQVLVLSTDTEIAGELAAGLRPHVSRSYTLCQDDSSACTVIRPGYFDSLVAT